MKQNNCLSPRGNGTDTWISLIASTCSYLQWFDAGKECIHAQQGCSELLAWHLRHPAPAACDASGAAAPPQRTARSPGWLPAEPCGRPPPAGLAPQYLPPQHLPELAPAQTPPAGTNNKDDWSKCCDCATCRLLSQVGGIFSRAQKQNNVVSAVGLKLAVQVCVAAVVHNC